MKMNRSLAFVTIVCLTAVAATAQDKPRVSPTQTVKAQIDGADVSITYGAPYTKDPKSGRATQNLGWPGSLRASVADGRERSHDSHDHERPGDWRDDGARRQLHFV